MLYLWTFLQNWANAEERSLPDTLALLEAGNTEIQIARLQADVTNLKRLQTLSMLAPSVQAKANWLDFGEPLDVFLMGDGSQDIDCTAFESFGFGDLCSSFSEPLRLREAQVFDGSIQAVLPVSALYSIIQGHAAQQNLLEIQEYQIEITRQRLNIATIELYLQALQLEQHQSLIEQSIKLLDAHHQTVKAFVDQGLLNPIELSRISVAQKESTLGLLQLQNAYNLLLDQLELLVGQPITPIPLEQQPIVADNFAIQDNPDLHLMDLQYQAAKHGLSASYGSLLPTVAVLAASTKSQGQGSLQPTAQQYVGLALQGDFAWGQKWMDVQQQKLQVQMLEQGRQTQEQAVVLQQQATLQKWQQAQSQIEIAQLKRDIAKEAHRQAQAQFSQQQITVADLLDIETEYQQSQLTLTKAQHQSIIEQAKYQQTLTTDTIRFE